MGSTVFRNPWQIHLRLLLGSAVRISVSVVFGKCKPLHEREELVLVGGSGLRRVCAVVGSSHVEGRSHLTARTVLVTIIHFSVSARHG